MHGAEIVQSRVSLLTEELMDGYTVQSLLVSQLCPVQSMDSSMYSTEHPLPLLRRVAGFPMQSDVKAGSESLLEAIF